MKSKKILTLLLLVLISLMFLYFQAIDSKKNTTTFVYGLNETEIPNYYLKAKNGDYEASRGLALTFMKSKYDKQLASNWLWYTMYLGSGDRHVFMGLLANEYPCPDKNKMEMKYFIKNWKEQEESKKYLAIFPFLRINENLISFNENVKKFEKKCLLTQQ